MLRIHFDNAPDLIGELLFQTEPSRLKNRFVQACFLLDVLAVPAAAQTTVTSSG